LPVLTEVDGSMAPLEEFDDSSKGYSVLSRFLPTRKFEPATRDTLD
jgi:hypothetical protein